MRFAAAVALWSHALLLLTIPIPRLELWAARWHLTASEGWIVLLLALFSILSSYGFKRMAVDLTYIYFFPFILLFYLAGVTYLVLSFIFTRLRGGNSANPQAPTSSVIEVPNPKTPPALPSSAQPHWSWRFLRASVLELSRPFRQFTLLWGLLLLLSSKPILIGIALAIVLAHIARALLKIGFFSILSFKWLSQVEEKLKSYAEGLIKNVLDIPLEGELNQDLNLKVLQLVGIKAGIVLFQKRKVISYSLILLSLAVLLLTYFYLGLIFSFGYYGLAKVQSIPYSWGEALVTALFIPVAYTDLPRNLWMKLLGGFHWVFVVVLGLTTILGYVQRKVDSLQSVAQSLRERMDIEEIRVRLEKFSPKVQQPTQPKT